MNQIVINYNQTHNSDFDLIILREPKYNVLFIIFYIICVNSIIINIL